MPLSRREREAFMSLQSAVFGKSAWGQVIAASTSEIPLTLVAPGVFTAPQASVDGVTLSEGMTLLLKDQSLISLNGVWVVAEVSDGLAYLSRSDLYRSALQLNNAVIEAVQGEQNSGFRWVISVTEDYITNSDDVNVNAAPGMLLDGGAF
ncbi:hypothetical protein SAMN05428958_11610 [Pantoea sesami]|nr:hypothetical protein SAMN05428958_11610 [Pantoea sesami]